MVSADAHLGAEDWKINSGAEWAANIETSQGETSIDGIVLPGKETASLSTKLRTFKQKRKAKAVVIDQSLVWQNWNPIANIGPANLQDAPVLLTVAPGDYSSRECYAWSRRHSHV